MVGRVRDAAYNDNTVSIVQRLRVGYRRGCCNHHHESTVRWLGPHTARPLINIRHHRCHRHSGVPRLFAVPRHV